MAKHIDEFEKLMISKGFDGYFLCNIGFRGQLRESLHQYLTEALQGHNSIRPFHLTTYTLWKGDTHIKCDFKMTYDKSIGLKIDKLEAGYVVDPELNPVRTIELRPRTNEDIPTRTKVNSIVGPRKKRHFKL